MLKLKDEGAEIAMMTPSRTMIISHGLEMFRIRGYRGLIADSPQASKLLDDHR